MSLFPTSVLKRAAVSLTAAALLVSTMAGCGGGKTEPAPANSAAPAGSQASESTATVEPKGKVLIYTSMYEDIIEQMDEALEERFPDCDIEFFYGGTGTLQAKIAAEIDAKRLGCDMMMLAEPAYSLELKEKGLLHAYQSPQADSLAFDYDAEGYWYPVRLSNMVLAYNPDKYAKSDIPNSLYDFAYDANVKGAISMGNPLTSGTAMAAIAALREKYGYEYFEALGKQNVMVESGSVGLTKLETGECKVIMILEESILKKREEEGSKLEVIYPEDGTVMVPSTIMTVANDWSANQNIEACQAITDWFLSEEGQANVVAGWMHSVRKDYGTLPFDAIPTTDIQANNMPVDWEKCYKEREQVRTKFEESVKIEKK